MACQWLPWYAQEMTYSNAICSNDEISGNCLAVFESNDTSFRIDVQGLVIYFQHAHRAITVLSEGSFLKSLVDVNPVEVVVFLVPSAH